MRVISNGYDLAQFRPDPQAGAGLWAQWGVTPDTFLLGMVGRFDPQKDHANLFAALAVLKQRGHRPRCVLVGTGLDTGNLSLMDLARAAGVEDTLIYLGQRNDIPAVMNALDVHVLTSVSEAFPNVLCEAMACETPCVATDVGDARVIVDKTGWICPPRDPQALALALEKVMTCWADTARWEARCRAARQRVADHFDIQRMVAAYHEVWFKACAGQRP
jgi:glycosyltransferase involved in cell wall biosynthesis